MNENFEPGFADNNGSYTPPVQLIEQKEENVLVHALIEDGHLNDYNLTLLGVTRKEITAYLQSQDLTERCVFFLGADDNGNFYCVKKDK